MTSASALLFGVCSAVAFDSSGKLPFIVGEKLTYDISVEKLGKVGEGSMWVEGPVDTRGINTYLLRFDSRVRIALLSGVSRSSSWYDPVSGSSLRYSKHERNVLMREDESVDMYPDQKLWKSDDGRSGESPDESPLDELSFIYFIRTLPLVRGPVQQFDRHFDAARNPVMIQVLGPETIATPLGRLKTVLVEMRVRDPKHYKKVGVIRINLTDDQCRLPARIASAMPVVGKAVLTIKSQNASPNCAKP